MSWFPGRRSRLQYYPCDSDDIVYGGARRIVDEEIKYLKEWRGRAPIAGIALSGGGIRSASFCLGVLQAFAHLDLLRGFDYLSTVSGGGYIGGSLSYLLDQAPLDTERFGVSRGTFPYLSYPMVSAPDEAMFAKGRLLRRLRQNAKYLAPGNGLTVLSLIAATTRSLLASASVHAAIIFLALVVLMALGALPFDNQGPNLVLRGSAVLFSFCLGLSALYVTATVLFDWLSNQTPHGPRRVYAVRRVYDRWVGHRLLLLALTLLVVGALPVVRSLIQAHGVQLKGIGSLEIGSLAAALGGAGNLWGFLQTRSKKPPKIPTRWLVAVASGLLLFGVLLLVFHLAVERWQSIGPLIGGALGILVALGWFSNINYVSLHRFYRDRLMETFMPDLGTIGESRTERGASSRSGDETLLGRLCGVRSPRDARTPEEMLARGPYHIINANAVLVSSRNARYRARGGDNFIFSPLVSGSRATGWAETDASVENGMTLATAIAVSGAAVSPNAGCGDESITRQPVLSVLMGMLNIRMGYWHRNPKNHERPAQTLFSLLKERLKGVLRVSRRRASEQDTTLRNSIATALSLAVFRIWELPNMIFPGLAESFGRTSLNEDSPWVLLSDGGHFDNLGLYELVRRRLKVIVVCDGTSDPESRFADLANTIELVRADFGATIDITSEMLEALVPRRPPGDEAAMAVARQGYLRANIRYARRPKVLSTESEGVDAEEETGELYYLTTTFLKELTADLHGYRRTHPEFPEESTGNQFFDEKQFEAYRELGFQTALGMLRGSQATKPAESWEVAVLSIQ